VLKIFQKIEFQTQCVRKVCLDKNNKKMNKLLNLQQ